MPRQRCVSPPFVASGPPDGSWGLGNANYGIRARYGVLIIQPLELRAKVVVLPHAFLPLKFL